MDVQAPAKINLTLRVRGKRADGYHEVESVMQMLTLADRLTIDSAEEIVFTCSDPALAGEGNLVVRAARMLRTHCGVTRGARVHLTKHIPAQAGLGGGSSDAAAVLLALNEWWEVRLPLETLAVLAAQLGADVPFFLDGPAAIVRGRGEQVTPLIHATVAHVVLAKPAAGLSTPAVYGQLHAPPYAGHAAHALPETVAMVHALQRNDLATVARALVNDLEGPALPMLPALYRLRERLLEQGCLGVLLCGSGSAVCGICPDAQTAQHAALDLTNDCPWTAHAAFCAPMSPCP